VKGGGLPHVPCAPVHELVSHTEFFLEVVAVNGDEKELWHSIDISTATPTTCSRLSIFRGKFADTDMRTWADK